MNAEQQEKMNLTLALALDVYLDAEIGKGKSLPDAIQATLYFCKSYGEELLEFAGQAPTPAAPF